MENITNPWDKCPKESLRAYQHFRAYRDMLNDDPFKRRNLAELAKQLNLSVGYFQNLSKKHKWTNRASAYDVYLDKQFMVQHELNAIKMRKEHAWLASAVIKRMVDRVSNLLDEEISASDIARLMDVGVKVERLSRGEFTENRQIHGKMEITHQEKINFSKLSDGELVEFEKLLAKLHTESDSEY